MLMYLSLHSSNISDTQILRKESLGVPIRGGQMRFESNGTLFERSADTQRT